MEPTYYEHLNKMNASQSAFDAKLPPVDCEDEGHEWKFVKGNEEVSLYRCRNCGKESLQ